VALNDTHGTRLVQRETAGLAFAAAGWAVLSRALHRSFGRDVRWLRRTSRTVAAPRPRAEEAREPASR
jgi:hypothetical protein